MTGDRRFSVDDLAGAIEADLVAHVATLYQPPAGEVHSGDGYVWFMTGLPSSHHNGILRSPVPHGRFDLPALLHEFEERSLPLMWWFFTSPRGLSSGAKLTLEDAGFTLESNRPGMAVHLDDLKVSVPREAAEVQRVTDEAMFDRWTEVVTAAFGSPELADGLSNAAFRRIGFSESAPFRHYVCGSGGRALAAVTLTARGDFAGVSNMATVPERRGRGLGSYVLSQALADVGRLGVAVAVLSADDLGARLYKSLGFEIVGRHLTYVRTSLRSGQD